MARNVFCRLNFLFSRLLLMFTVICVVYMGTRYYYLYYSTSNSSHNFAVSTSGETAKGQAKPSGGRMPWRNSGSHETRDRQRHWESSDSRMTDDEQGGFKTHGRAKMKVKVPQVQQHDNAHHLHHHPHHPAVAPQRRVPQRLPDDIKAFGEKGNFSLPVEEPSLSNGEAVDEHRHDSSAVTDKRLRWKRKLPPIEKAELEAGKSVQGSRSDSGESSGLQATLPVYIVEEHHEALLYWHGAFAAETKRRGKQPLPFSLVHIDGHSDGGPIMPDKRYHFSAKTGSAENIKYLMTANDNFIMGSKFAGLVSNGLWIIPTWSNGSSTDIDIRRTGITKINDTLLSCDCPHYKQDRRTISAGTANNSDTPTQASFDTCFIENQNKPESRIWFERKHCYFLKGPHLQISAPEDKINSWVISAVLARKILLPAARPDESTISSLYQPMEKPEDHNDYLLDIDEDFFGVQLAGRQLVSAGIPLTIVREMKKSLELLFCPGHTGQEIEADRWFVAMLDSVAKYTAVCVNKAIGESECHVGDVARMVTEDQTLNTLLGQAACPGLPAFKLQRLTEEIIPTLVKLTPEQLRVLQSVGLCLGVSLSTNLNPLDSLARANATGDKSRRRQVSFRSPQPIVKFCLGNNLPNNSAVLEFLDTRQGLDARLAAMTKILKRLPKPPVAVTICRSSRDGYVPRQQMNYIESGILAALRSAFGHTDVKYDANLHYGREGWFNYKAKQLGVNFRWSGDKL